MKRYYDWLLSLRIDGETIGQAAGYITVGGAVAFLVIFFYGMVYLCN